MFVALKWRIMLQILAAGPKRRKPCEGGKARRRAADRTKQFAKGDVCGGQSQVIENQNSRGLVDLAWTLVFAGTGEADDGRVKQYEFSKVSRRLRIHTSRTARRRMFASSTRRFCAVISSAWIATV